MTSDSIDPVQRLITRRLDGELSEDQQLDLDRALLRDPDLRNEFDRHAQIDALSATALRAAVESNELSFDPLTLTQAKPHPSLWHRVAHHPAWWLMPLAAAALLLFATVPNWFGFSGEGNETALNKPRPEAIWPQAREHTNQASPLAQQPAWRTVDYQPEKVRRVTERELIGVLGEDGKVYMLELGRRRTVKKPRPEAQHPVRVGEW